MIGYLSTKLGGYNGRLQKQNVISNKNSASDVLYMFLDKQSNCSNNKKFH